ncbi:uncharacterized protein LOC110367718 isoform X1 [Fundulus heteroclitus]|uniref:uncharacterized protein LOC110367718 isoform X1 n=1 Tax=Fundulus heteroclitus TaxID=8078 RepID=UPI00165C28BB|nr:uncharacterized protein LOC110367718 isoform X1 [Fundulus heteroclitus]
MDGKASRFTEGVNTLMHMKQNIMTSWLMVPKLFSCVSGLVFLMFPAAELSSLNCSVIRLPSCTFRYRPAQWTRSAGCNAFWEDHDRVVIAQDSEFNQTLVETLTDEHIDLKICQRHLRYTLDCLKAVQTVDCRVNCSLLELHDCPPAAKFCFSESACFDSFTAGLFFGGVAGAVLLVLIIWWAVTKYKRRKSAAVNVLYAAPTDQVQKLEDGALGKQIHIHVEPAELT